ncbi:MAG: hypothetical protein K8Q97_02495 [Candidatus Andersenbacteria bacterium]|nr:hypothetical protein [Candidatus Andersenbacteria bacterium]
MVTFDNFREIMGLLVLILGFSVALLLLPDAMKNPAVVYAPNLLPSAESGTQVEKIAVPIHNLFAN